MSRRLSVILLAVALGVFGTGAVALYAHRADNRAAQGEQTVAVLVAKAAIPAGTPVAAAAQQGLVEQESLPTKLVPAGALTDLGAVSNQVASSDIAPQQVLLAQLFTSQALTGALPIPPGKLAITVSLSDSAQRVAGFVVPGSDVAVFDNYAQPGGAHVTRLLLGRAQVLAVGATTLTKTQQGADTSATLMTLALSQNDAERVIQASLSGKLYFGLLNAKTSPAPDAGVGDATLFQ